MNVGFYEENDQQKSAVDQGLPSFGHLAKSPFLENVLVLEKLHFRDDLGECMK